MSVISIGDSLISPQQSELVSHADLGDLVIGIAQGEHSDISSDRIAAERIGIGSINPDVCDKEFWDRLLRCAYRDQKSTFRTPEGTVDRNKWELT